MLRYLLLLTFLIPFNNLIPNASLYYKSECKSNQSEVINKISTSLNITPNIVFVDKKMLFDKCKRSGLLGCATSNDIFVWEDLYGDIKLNVITHEMFHNYQISKNFHNMLEYHVLEKQALKFGNMIVDEVCK